MLAAVFPDVSRSSPNDEGASPCRNSVTGDSVPKREFVAAKKNGFWISAGGTGSRPPKSSRDTGYGVPGGLICRLPMFATGQRSTTPGGERQFKRNLASWVCFAGFRREGAVCLFSTLGMIRRPEKIVASFSLTVRRIVRARRRVLLARPHRYAR